MAKKDAPPPLNITLPPTGTSAGSADDPYGLGPNYGNKAIPHSASLVNGVAAKGKKGTLTANQVLDYFHTLQKTDPGMEASLQALLYRGGFYSANAKFLPGVIRKPDEAALIAAMKSLSAGDSLADYLNRAAQVGDALGINSTGGSRQPLVKQYTSPTDIEEIVKATAPTVIGRNLAPGEVAQIVSGYHALEGSAQEADYNANGSTGTSYTAPPSVADYVKQQTRAIAPVEAGVYDRETAAQTFFKAITSGGPQTATF